jgi:cell division protein FtsB
LQANRQAEEEAALKNEIAALKSRNAALEANNADTQDAVRQLEYANAENGEKLRIREEDTF